MMRGYLRSNSSLSPHEKHVFADNVYKLVKHKVFLDTIAAKPISWDSRLEAVYSEKFASQRKNTSLLP